MLKIVMLIWFFTLVGFAIYLFVMPIITIRRNKTFAKTVIRNWEELDKQIQELQNKLDHTNGRKL